MVNYLICIGAGLSLSLGSCKRTWSEKDKSEFVSGCISGAKTDLGEDKAKQYCQCMLQRIMDKYPNANDARYLQYDTSISRIGRECRNQP